MQCVRELALQVEGWVLNPSRDKPQLKQQVVTAPPLLNARQ